MRERALAGITFYCAILFLIQASAPAATRRYAFATAQSVLRRTGGFAGVDETYNLAGTVTLSVDIAGGTASIDGIDCEYGTGQDLYQSLHADRLRPADVNEAGAVFDTEPLPGAPYVRLNVGFGDGFITLAAWFCEPYPDGFCYELDAVAEAIRAAVIYVDDDAATDGDGHSWATAYKYLQDGLADANSSAKPVEIRVAAGTYRPDRSAAEPNGTGDRLASFELFSDLALVGGYAGLGTPEPNDRDPHLYETILSGDLDSNDVAVDDPCDLWNESTRSENSCNVVEIVSASAIRLEGFTITGGFANISGRDGPTTTAEGAGLRAVEVNNITVKDCVFVGNYASWSQGGCGISGIGMTVDNCRFTRNSSNFGGGLWIGGSAIILSQCEITGNCGDNGGGMLAMGDVTLLNCILSGNIAGAGGGARLSEGTVSFMQCVIKDNSADWGGGIAIDGWPGSVTYDFRECVFCNNTAVTDGGAMYVAAEGNVSLVPKQARFFAVWCDRGGGFVRADCPCGGRRVA